MSAPALPAAVEAAVDWMVLLSSGEASAADRARFEAWHRTDPRHAAAWDMVTGALDSTFAPLGEGASSRAAGAALLAPTSRRRALRNALMLALAAGGLAALVDRQTPLRTLAADLRTGTGERTAAHPLPDGSVVTLNARSAVDLQFDDRVRVLRLREGAVYVRVAADAARPFIVASPDGEVQALGTVFGVARDARGSVACVIEHSVEIRAAGQRRTLAAGEGARFGADGISAPDAALAEAAALGNDGIQHAGGARPAAGRGGGGIAAIPARLFAHLPRGRPAAGAGRVSAGRHRPRAGIPAPDAAGSRSPGWAAGWSASTCAPMPPKKNDRSRRARWTYLLKHPLVAGDSMFPVRSAPQLAAAFLIALAAPAGTALAQAGAQTGAPMAQRYDLPAAPLAETLTRIARQSGHAVSVDPALVAGRQAPAVAGTYTAEQALRQALAGSGLELRITANGTFSARPLPQAGDATLLEPVRVTGAVESPSGPLHGYAARVSATGTKTDTPIIETPQSITVVGAEEIETLKAQSLQDALGYVAGVSRAEGQDRTSDSLFLRGFRGSQGNYYRSNT